MGQQKFSTLKDSKPTTEIIYSIVPLGRMKIAPSRLIHYASIALFIGLCFSGVDSWAQTRIQLIRAGSLEGYQSQGMKRFLDDVVFEHQGYYLYCDSAWLYDATNSLDAFGNIRIKGDTLDLWGDRLNYEGNTRIATVTGNVRLKDKQVTLTTNNLRYNLDKDIGNYYGGGKIVDSENNLTSKVGYYHARERQLFFKDDVVLINPEYRMDGDTLIYHTETEVATFFGPTVIRSEDNLIYCEDGWYDTKNDVSRFSKRAWLSNTKQKITGDSLYYDRRKGLGRAIGNAIFTDTVEHIALYGNRGVYLEQDGFCMITDSAISVMVDKKDSLFLHADTILLHLDKNRKGELLLAYHHAKFFRPDIQGMTDSMAYNLKDSILRMYHNPILWSSNYQMSASLIELRLRKGSIDSMVMHDPAIIAIMEDSVRYNQVKGRMMTGYFEGKELRKLHVAGNAESLYFLRDEKGFIIGVNKAECSYMDLNFDSKELSSVLLIKDPKEILYREKDLKIEDLYLKGFEWRGEDRPRNKHQIF